MDISGISHAQVELDSYVVDFLGTLFRLAGNFAVDTEFLLQHPGFRSRSWVEALFEVGASYGCFKGVPFEALQPYITQNIVALFCLAGDIMEASFYEYFLIKRREEILRRPDRTREDEQILKRLREARIKFVNQKKAYLKLAFAGTKVPKEMKRAFDLNVIIRGDQLQREVRHTIEGMPHVFEFYPRDNSSDLAPLSRLYIKYSQLFAQSEESDSSASEY